jgi:hypothetical protein
MKKMIYLLTLTLFFGFIIPAQTFLSVELTDPVYEILDNAAQRGLIENLPSVKPYSRAQVISFLEEVLSQGNRLRYNERETAKFFLERFKTPQMGSKYANYPAQGPLGSFQAGFKMEGDSRINFNNPESWHTYNGLLAYLSGDIGGALSYYGAVGGSVNKVAPDYFYKHITMEPGRSGSPYYIENGEVQWFQGENWDYTAPGAFAPYSFTAQWDGHHTDIATKGHNDGVIAYPSFAMRTEDEITLQKYDGDLTVRWGKMRREWGYGDGSLYLSGSAYPFAGFETHLRPTDWFNFSFVAGSLGNWFIDSYLRHDLVTDPTDPDYDADRIPMLDQYSAQKMFSLQQFELKPTSWLSLTAASSAIWGKRFELAYLSPLMLPFVIQELNGDMDNVALTAGLNARLPWGGRLYYTFFLDETSGSQLSRIFTYARNMYAYQGGIQTALPWLPFSTLTLQYTKIHPFVYSHYYETDYVYAQFPVDTTYTHAGENLGYFLPPNSDEILVKMEFFPKPGLKALLKYQLIRHGTNDPTGMDENSNGIPDGQIYGDIYIPFDYPRHTAYPDKDFLKDGVYDWSNILTVGASYRFPNYPMQVGLTYIFAHTFWDTNGRSITTPDSITQNIISLTYTLFK